MIVVVDALASKPSTAKVNITMQTVKQTAAPILAAISLTLLLTLLIHRSWHWPVDIAIYSSIMSVIVAVHG